MRMVGEGVCLHSEAMDCRFSDVLACGRQVIFTVVLLTVMFILPHQGAYLREYHVKDLWMCNVTLNWTTFPQGFNLRLPETVIRSRDRPLLCQYTFLAPEHHKVAILLLDLHAGMYIERTNRCQGGYIRIWDGSRDTGRHVYPPSTFCGYYDNGNPINVLRVSTGSQSEMDFYVSHVTPMTTFRVDVTFLDLENTTAVDLYPKQIRSYMEPVQNTASVCYWRLYIDSCPDQCPVLSPGYPGIYPPNTECFYHVTSTRDNTVLQIRASGSAKKPLEFNLQYKCRTDYLEIYDGNTKRHNRKIGRFCGQYFPNITTSSSDVIIYFVSGSTSPPYNYTGFHLSIIEVTKEWHKDGYQLPNTMCSWRFNATAGSTSSPEHWLPKKTSCEYGFRIQRGHYLELILHIYGLEHNCMDYVQVMDGFNTVSRICDRSMAYPQETFRYNLTSSYVVVTYYTTSGQMEGQASRGFWLSYRQIPVPRQDSVVTESSEKAQPVVNYVYNKGSHLLTSSISRHVPMPCAYVIVSCMISIFST